MKCQIKSSVAAVVSVVVAPCDSVQQQSVGDLCQPRRRSVRSRRYILHSRRRPTEKALRYGYLQQ